MIPERRRNHLLPMVLLETRHAVAALEAERNKTEKNDARGLAPRLRSIRVFSAAHSASA
jgi:hypothetical protein